jgi:hypothetical protein
MKKPQPSENIVPTPPNVIIPDKFGGEITVEFNRCMVIYSNNVTGNLSSRWRAGMTGISCYMDSQFVGVLYFYPDNISLPASYRDPNGVIVLSYPLSSFHDTLTLVKENKPLYLFFVEKDEQNNPLKPPVGAIATAQQPIGG